jgi:hypothetical protein
VSQHNAKLLRELIANARTRAGPADAEFLDEMLRTVDSAIESFNRRIRVYFDGNKPTNCWTGSFIIKPYMPETKHVPFEASYAATRYQASYGALILALNELINMVKAGSLSPEQLSLEYPVVIHGDSELVVNQACGKSRCKDPVLRGYFAEAFDLQRRLQNMKVQVRFEHIPRKLNKKEMGLPD